MATSTTSEQPVSVRVENIGGITETAVELEPGVTILTGRNATNRTSLLTAIMAAIGSDEVALKGDADEGLVELTIGDTTYSRRLIRRDGTITTEGNPYLEDATLVDLFVCLLETNDARQAVALGDDLREIIMEPVDTAYIEEDIDRKRSQRDEIDAQIEKVEQLEERIPELKTEKAELGDEIDGKRQELSEIESQIDDLDRSIDERRDEQRELEEALEQLKEVRSDLESVRHELDTQQSSLDALRGERDELEEERESYEDVPDGRLDELEAEINRLRERKTEITESIDELQTVIEFNENLLEGDLDLFEEISDDEGDLTDQLLVGSDEVVCWTCGSETDTDQIESMLSTLRDLYGQYMDHRRDVDDEIDDLTDQRLHLEERRRQHTQIRNRLEAIEEEIDQREARVEELTERRNKLTEEVERLESEVESLQSDDEQDSELLELHKEANRLEVEIERLEETRDDVAEELEELQARVADREDLQARREQLETEIQDLRTRVKRLEEEAVAQFNDHMASLLETLDYDNLERIWIERTEREVREGRETVTRGSFELHVVRTTEDGTVYEDTVDHLSESEREVTGLVFALAGYLVHDVHEEVPFMLLDSVEAIDAPRIAALVEYFEEYTDYLVIALLEEDAQALDDGYRRVTEI